MAGLLLNPSCERAKVSFPRGSAPRAAELSVAFPLSRKPARFPVVSDELAEPLQGPGVLFHFPFTSTSWTHLV